MKRFQAQTNRGLGIITVLADNEEEAKKRIEEELSKNPSRKPYLNQWKEDGEIVVEKE